MSRHAGAELRFAKVGQGRTHPVEREARALLGDAHGSRAALPRVRASARAISLGDEQTPLAVRMQQPTLGGDVDRQVIAQRGEHVVHEPAALVDVPRILRRDPRQTLAARRAR